MQNSNSNVNIIDELALKNEDNSMFGILYKDIKIPIRAKPYKHQIEAVVFALWVLEGGDGIDCSDTEQNQT